MSRFKFGIHEDPDSYMLATRPRATRLLMQKLLMKKDNLGSSYLFARRQGIGLKMGEET